MSNIAFMTLLNRENTTLSPHFGKAKWVMIQEPGAAPRFVQNAGLNGQAVVDILVANACTAVVFTEIGPGALHHLRTHNIRGWFAPANLSATEAAAMFVRGALKPALAPSKGHGSHACGHATRPVHQ